MSRLTLASLLLLVTAPAWAHGSHHGHSGEDRASFGNDIVVSENDTAGDIACAFCSVHLHGDSHGDVAVLFGSVTIDQGHGVSGDVAVCGGDVSLGDDASIMGDLAVFAGDLQLSSDASIHGSRAVFPGRVWLIALFAPILIVIGVIWLLVWFVRRNRYRPPYGAPTQRF
jgi:hypothetical protein